MRLRMARHAWMLGISVSVLFLFLLGARADGPSTNTPSSAPDANAVQQAVTVARAYCEAVYRSDYATAFRYVRGISDPTAAAQRFHHAIQNETVTLAFEKLSVCESNVESLVSAVQSYARDHDGKYPPTLSTLVDRKSVYLVNLPQCPAHGVYQYRHDTHGFSIYCHKDAHAQIGVKGDFPAYSPGAGLTIGGQKLNLSYEPRFTVRDFSVTYDNSVPAFRVLIVRISEDSAIESTSDVKHREGRLAMTCQNGEWLVDLYLSNAEMSYVYDLDRWQNTAPITNQVLYYYEYLKTPEATGWGYVDRNQLLLQVCESNLRDIDLAIEAWSVKHGGGYPSGDALKMLVPKYIHRLPICPLGGVYQYVYDPKAGQYTVFCKGHVHAAAHVPPNYPRIDPANGVSEGRSE